uniref:Gln-synt_C domain-containing protein n=1 Tax=Macrostomum lignano TaxID=282301 RepID=A0A1I8HG54_9PLAT
METFVAQLKATQLVRWVFCDTNGNARSKLIPGGMSAHFVTRQPRRFCTAVIPMTCNSELPHLAWVVDNGYPDCEMVPDPDSFHLVSWSKCQQPGSIGQVLCSTNWPDGGGPVEFDPRNVVRRQIDRLDRELGLKLASWTEMQWHLCKRGETGWTSTEPAGHLDGSQLMQKYEVLVSELCSSLMDAGIAVESVSPGSGAGQFCVSLGSRDGAAAADDAFMGREIVKQVAANHNLTATFMPIPHLLASASRLRINHQLVEAPDTRGDFKQPLKNLAPPQVLRHWLAGLVHHAPGIAALTWPTLNCYRSDKPGRRVTWSCSDLSTLASPTQALPVVDLRIAPMRSAEDGGDVVWRLENNLPSSAASAHIAVAATVAAGIDGILRRLELPTRPEEAPMLPADMASGLAALEADAVMADALGAQLFDFYREARLQFDLAMVAAKAHANESDSEALKREAKFYLEFH